ncbi:hypothetical protein JCM10213_008515 [Rhodosporidiobolus nylandii]
MHTGTRSASVSSTTSASGPRRSSRTSKPPPSTAAPKNPVTKVVKGRGKRAASVSDVSEDEEDEEEESSDEDDRASSGSRKRKAPSKAASAPRKKASTASGARAVRALPKPRKIIEGINPISRLYDLFPLPSAFSGFDGPAVPEAERAPRAVFIFGTGDMGQFGLGTDVLDEIKRPRRHAWFKEQIEADAQGWENGVADLNCGGMHTLAVDGEGRVWSWGINDNAALGRLTNKPGVEAEELESNPGLVEKLSTETKPFKAVRVAAGDSVSLAISDRGDIRAWGSFRSAEGLLGFDGSSGSEKTQLVPTALANLAKHTVVQVACGDDHFLALTSDGKVFACGNGEQNQLGRKIIQRHKTHGLTPERLNLKNIVLVGTGSYHSFAVNKDGEVFAWGLNSFRQTGVAEDDGGWADVIATPTKVAALSPSKHDGARVVQIVAGAHHSLFLFSNGKVYVCGRSDGHETGLPDSHPEMQAAHERKEEALKARKKREDEEKATRFGEDGAVTATDDDGKLLTSEQAAFAAYEAAAQAVELPNDYILEPVLLEFPKEPKENSEEVRAIRKVDDFDEDLETEETFIVQIAAGTRHNFAVSSRGYAYSWGVGTSSQLGQGDEEEIETPTRIWNTALNNVRVLRAETGGQHAVIIGVDRNHEELDAARQKKRDERKAELEKEAAEKKAQEEAAAAEAKAKEEAEKPAENGDVEMKEGEEAAEAGPSGEGKTEDAPEEKQEEEAGEEKKDAEDEKTEA